MEDTGSHTGQGAINSSAVSDIRWLPNSDNLFLAAHMDGSLIVYDKEKEDALFLAEDQTASNEQVHGEEKKASLVVKKSVNSKNQKTNPVSYWKTSNSKINAFAFSPDCRHVAVVSEDGSFRIIDFLREQWVPLPWEGVLGWSVAYRLQAITPIHELLWRDDVRVLVAGRAIRCHGRAGRPGIHLVAGG